MTTTELHAHRTVSQTRQSVWDVRRTFKSGDHKMRVDIHHDPYEFQAHARLQLLDPSSLSWNNVHELPTEDWYDSLDVLRAKDFTTQHLNTIDAINRALVKIGEDLLS